MRAIRTTIALAAAALAAAAPAAAEAATPNPGLKQAKFRATLSGSQVTTWELHRANDPNDPCDASAEGFGDQTIKFSAGRRFEIVFSKPPRRQPNLLLTNGRPSVLTSPIFLTLKATADRNGDYKVGYGDVEEGNCGPPASGGGGGGQPEEPDCGRRSGQFHARLFFHDPSTEEELQLPLTGRQPPEKNHLRLEGLNYQWQGADGSEAYGGLDNAYRDCPLLLNYGYVESAGNIWTTAAKVSERRLFDRRRRSIVVSGHTIQRFSGDRGTGQTILAWNLRLKRVK